MFKKNNNPDYYNDAIRDARVNSENIDNQSNAKGKLLLIFNLFLISAILGYFIYQNISTDNSSQTAVMGVNYTVDIHEEKSSNNTTHNKEIADTKAIIDNELTGKSVHKSEKKHQNRELENILSEIDTKGFSQRTNVVKIDNEAPIDTDLDLDELANVVNSLVLEENLKSSDYENQLNK